MKCTLALARTFPKTFPHPSNLLVPLVRKGFPLAPKDGRSTSLNAIVATGSRRWRGIRANGCFSGERSRPGSGHKPAPLFGGSLTERRYAKALWDLASVYLTLRDCSGAYRTRKVWREGLEVAIKIKGSQGQRRVVWVNPEHPFTAISPIAEVHANHNEAQNAVLRRRCSAYRRRQNLYAKTRAGLQRVLDVQRIIHNWVRPHWGLGKRTTPAMAIGLCSRPLSTQEILCMRGFQSISS